MQQVTVESASSEYAVAFSSLRRAKNVFLTLVILALLIQLGSAGVVRFSKLLDPLHAKAAAATKTPTSAPADLSKKLEQARLIENIMTQAMPLAKFFGMTACLLLMLTFLLAVKLSLLDRMGGVAGLISAMLWSIVLLPLLIPWQQIMAGDLAYGALSNYNDLLVASCHQNPAWGGTASKVADHMVYFSRFFAYPGLALVICLMAQCKFAQGFRRISAFHPTAQQA